MGQKNIALLGGRDCEAQGAGGSTVLCSTRSATRAKVASCCEGPLRS